MPTPPKSFDEPVPASRARSRAQQIVDQNRNEVERAIGDKSRRELTRILLDAQRQIADGQRTTNTDATWTHLDLNQTMILVQDALGHASGRFKDLLERQREQAYAVGAKSTAEMLTYYEGGKDTGTVRPLAIREALAMKRMALDEHATSVDRYGVRMIHIIRRELQGGIVRGATFHEMTDLLVGRKGPRGPKVSLAATVGPDGKVRRLVEAPMKRGLFVEHRGWAERIVRTEGARAYAAGTDEEISRQKATFPDLKRKLIETFDNRTAPDSYVAHGQVRGSNEPFFDGKHTYLRPPGRPNDRAALIPWRDVWAGKDGKGGTDEDGELTPDELGVLNGTPERKDPPAPHRLTAGDATPMSPTPPPTPPATRPIVVSEVPTAMAMKPSVTNRYPRKDPAWPPVARSTAPAHELWEKQAPGSTVYGDVSGVTKTVFQGEHPTPDALAKMFAPDGGSVRWTKVFAHAAKDGHPPKLEMEGEMLDGAGNVVAPLSRSLWRERGKLVAEHGALYVKKGEQEKGVAEGSVRNSLRGYIQLGVAEVRISAQDGGRYAWSSFGFAWPAQPERRGEIERLLIARGVAAEQAADVAAMAVRAGGNIALSQLRVGGQHIGREVMLAMSGYPAVLPLDTSKRGFVRATERVKVYRT